MLRQHVWEMTHKSKVIQSDWLSLQPAWWRSQGQTQVHRFLKRVYPLLTAQPGHSAVHLLTFLCTKAVLIELTASSAVVQRVRKEA